MIVHFYAISWQLTTFIVSTFRTRLKLWDDLNFLYNIHLPSLLLGWFLSNLLPHKFIINFRSNLFYFSNMYIHFDWLYRFILASLGTNFIQLLGSYDELKIWSIQPSLEFHFCPNPKIIYFNSWTDVWWFPLEHLKR